MGPGVAEDNCDLGIGPRATTLQIFKELKWDIEVFAQGVVSLKERAEDNTRIFSRSFAIFL